MNQTDVPEYRCVPNDAPTPIARLLVEISNLVPAGRWVSYGDLGVAAGIVTKSGRLGETHEVARGVASALSFRPPREGVGTWRVPWHRVRLSNGNMKSRDRGEITTAQDYANRMFVAEGGTLQHGAASDRTRLPVAELRSRAAAAGLIDLST